MACVFFHLVFKEHGSSQAGERSLLRWFWSFTGTSRTAAALTGAALVVVWLPVWFSLAGSPPSIGDKSKVQCRPSHSWPPIPSTFDTLRSGCPVKSTRKGKNVLSGLGLQCQQWGATGSGMYQLSPEITDTKWPLQPLLNEFFFGVFLKHPARMSYGTSGTSATWPARTRIPTALAANA
jgi:hypothetical protein